MSTSFGIDFAAGCVGGAAGVLAGHPLDTVKVRLQTQNINAPAYKGTFHCFRTILQKEKIRGLYKGLSSPLMSVSIINAILFGAHGRVLKCFTDTQSVMAHFCAGFAAGSMQAFIATPSELLKLRVQLQNTTVSAVEGKFSSPQKTPYLLFKHIMNVDATQLRDSTGIGVYFGSYQYLTKNISRDGKMESLSSLQLLFSGGMAGTLSWACNYPVDVIKTRFQADTVHKSYLDVIRKTYMEGGYRTFFVGLGSTLIRYECIKSLHVIFRAFPTNAATFFAVEWTYRLIYLGKETGNCTEKFKLFKHIQNYQLQTGLDVWLYNSFPLPEAGSTSIDPFLHKCSSTCFISGIAPQRAGYCYALL